MVKRRAKNEPTIEDLIRQVEELRRERRPSSPMRTIAQMEESAATVRARHPGGRPKHDPGDLRSDRLGIRIHPDLRTELEALAREDGLRLAHYTERALVDHVNRVRGGVVLDRIGRYKDSR